MTNGRFCDFDNLPCQVVSKIFHLSANKSQPTIRLVCRRWKRIMDSVGLSCTINDRLRDPQMDFTEKHIVTDVKIIRVTRNSRRHEGPQFGYPDFVERVTCAGTISSILWFRRNLLQDCRFITHLKFHGAFFTYLRLFETFRDKERFPGLEHLKFFEIWVGSEHILGKETNEDHIEGLTTPMEVSIRKLERLDRNLSLILNGVRSRKLGTLRIYIGIEIVRAPPAIYANNWRYNPLEEFLEFHKDTLQRFIIPNFMGKICMDDMPNRILPQELKVLNFRTQNIEYQDSQIWKRFLMSQTKLEQVALKLIEFEPRWICLVTSSILMKNPNLKEVIIQVGAASSQQSSLADYLYEAMLLPMDGMIYSNCTQLTKLVLECDAPLAESATAGIFLNFANLPASLESLTIKNFVIRNVEVDACQGFPKLKYLFLNQVMVRLHKEAYYLSEYLQEDARAVYAFIRSTLRLRQLNFIRLDFWNEVPFNEDMICLVHQLRPDYIRNDWSKIQLQAIQFSPNRLYEAGSPDEYGNIISGMPKRIDDICTSRVFRENSTAQLEEDNVEGLQIYQKDEEVHFFVDCLTHEILYYNNEQYKYDEDEQDEDDEEEEAKDLEYVNAETQTPLIPEFVNEAKL